MFAWKYLLQIHQEDHIPCSVCSLEEMYSLIWFPAFIFLKGTNDNYCLLWSVFFSTNNSPKETSTLRMRCDSRQYASIFCIHTWMARAGTGTDWPASQCSPKTPRSFLECFLAFGGVVEHFLVFWSVVGLDAVSLCLKEGMCTCQLANISWPFGRCLAPKWPARMSGTLDINVLMHFVFSYIMHFLFSMWNRFLPVPSKAWLAAHRSSLLKLLSAH